MHVLDVWGQTRPTFLELLLNSMGRHLEKVAPHDGDSRRLGEFGDDAPFTLCLHLGHHHLSPSSPRFITDGQRNGTGKHR